MYRRTARPPARRQRCRLRRAMQGRGEGGACGASPGACPAAPSPRWACTGRPGLRAGAAALQDMTSGACWVGESVGWASPSLVSFLPRWPRGQRNWPERRPCSGTRSSPVEPNTRGRDAKRSRRCPPAFIARDSVCVVAREFCGGHRAPRTKAIRRDRHNLTAIIFEQSIRRAGRGRPYGAREVVDAPARVFPRRARFRGRFSLHRCVTDALGALRAPAHTEAHGDAARTRCRGAVLSRLAQRHQPRHRHESAGATVAANHR
jgi:hypothetical protein